MIDGVMNRSHWNRSRKSNMGVSSRRSAALIRAFSVNVGTGSPTKIKGYHIADAGTRNAATWLPDGSTGIGAPCTCVGLVLRNLGYRPGVVVPRLRWEDFSQSP